MAWASQLRIISVDISQIEQDDVVQSIWASKIICNFPDMNETLDIEGQVKITPRTSSSK